MSVLLQTNNCSLIDHQKYVLNLYQNTLETEDKVNKVGLNVKLFSMVKRRIENVKKRKHDTESILEEALFVRDRFSAFVKNLPTDTKESVQNKCIVSEDVRDLSKRIFEETVFDHTGISGGNNSNKSIKCKIKEEYFLIPPKSRFLCGCVKDVCKKLDGNKYDIVIADPPWWNKYIRRLKAANEKLSYSMMYNEDIASIPLKNLLLENCLIAVWCTNSPSNIKAVKNIIFPTWGVEYLTMWYWLKITSDMEPLYEFNTGCKKQPYERIILGKVGNVKNIPMDHLLISVPSALHSHKPPLIELLKPFVKEDPQVLELFARYLLPNTTSVGYEPLKWQHMSLYESVS